MNVLNIDFYTYHMKALIIDDEIDICYLLSGLLIKKKIQVDYVNSIADAVLALEKQKPEIIFLDNRLPDGKGVDFAGYIKNTYPAVKVAMITAYDSPTDRSIALSRGIDYFVGKPFTSDKIYETVDEMLN
jgi:two-component system, OmpR family, response regulator